MLKINLLQMKSKMAANAGSFAPILEALGIDQLSDDDILEFRGLALKAVAIAFGVWLATEVPDRILKSRVAELDIQLTELNTQLGQLRGELRSKQSVREEMKVITEKETQLKKKLTVITSLDEDRYAAFRVMDAISLLIPKEVWIKDFDLSDAGMVVRGESWEFLPINEFVGSMKQSPIFSDVRLVSIDSRDSPNPVEGVSPSVQKIKSFELRIQVDRSATKKSKS